MSWGASDTALAFVGTNPTDEPITSSLPNYSKRDRAASCGRSAKPSLYATGLTR